MNFFRPFLVVSSVLSGLAFGGQGSIGGPAAKEFIVLDLSRAWIENEAVIQIDEKSFNMIEHSQPNIILRSDFDDTSCSIIGRTGDGILIESLSGEKFELISPK